MKAQWCREHIDETAKNCCLKRSTINDTKQAAEFCIEHAEISACSTNTVLTLIRIPDEMLRDKVISSIEKSLELGIHPVTGNAMKKYGTGEYQGYRLSKKDILYLAAKIAYQDSLDPTETPVVKKQFKKTGRPKRSHHEKRVIAALAELYQWEEKYRGFSEFTLIFESAKKVKEEIPYLRIEKTI
jgi:hypothetical protein